MILHKNKIILHRQYIIFLAIIMLISSILMLYRLDNILLWQDEAETALVARNTLIYGIPKAWDGQNVVHQEGALDFNSDLVWVWHPWLQFYICALSYLICGINTFGARFLFVIFGLATIPLLYLFVYKEMNNRNVAIFSALLLGLSIPYILFIRQCRYYALMPFFALLMMLGYQLFIRESKIWLK